MRLIHICPSCGKEHEKESVPEPSQLCPICDNKISNLARIEIELDCGNTLLGKDEKLWLEISIEELLMQRNIQIKKMNMFP